MIQRLYKRTKITMRGIIEMQIKVKSFQSGFKSWLVPVHIYGFSARTYLVKKLSHKNDQNSSKDHVAPLEFFKIKMALLSTVYVVWK